MKEEILKLLKEKGEKGVLQSKIAGQLDLTKSTVSNHLSKLESKNKIFREKVAGKSKRVWLLEEVPHPVPRNIRIGIIRAAEYPHVTIASNTMDKNCKITVFNSAKNLTAALDKGKVDIGFSPLATQIFFSLVNKNIKISAGCARKGCGIISRKNPSEEMAYGSSQLSTMEMNLRAFLKEKDVDPYKTDIRYFNSAKIMIESYLKGETDAIAIWEPYLSILKSSEKNTKAYPLPDPLTNFPCCTMGVNQNFLKDNNNLFLKFMKNYKKATKSVKNKNDLKKGANLLSEIIKIDKSVLLPTLSNYRFEYKIDNEMIKQYIKKFDLKVPRRTLKEIIHTDYTA